jgi:hypothetical protein
MEQMDINYLKSHQCDLTLYNLVKVAKDRARNLNRLAYTCRIEGSTKVYKEGRTESGRYTITVLLSEFMNYTEKDKINIIKYLGFSTNKIVAIIQSKNNLDADIILGHQTEPKPLGKIYFDFNDGNLICYQSDNITKIYKGDYHSLIVQSEGPSDKAVHIRQEKPMKYKGYTVYWIANQSKYTTYYTRPNTSFLCELFDLYYFLRQSLH